MTFKEWIQIYTMDSDPFNEIRELTELPEWNEWHKRLEDVLRPMNFAESCNHTLYDLLKLAKISNEVSRAKKELIIHNRKQQLEQDFQ